MKARLEEKWDRRQNSEGGDRFAKSECVSLKGDFEQRRTGCGKTENKSACRECGDTDHFKAHWQFGYRRKRGGPAKTQHPTPKGGKSKGQKANEGKGSAKYVKSAFLEPIENDPVVAEIPGNDVNVATGQINSANASGVGDWERKNWPDDCSSIIDTGFNGG